MFAYEMVELEKVYTDETITAQSVNVIGILYDASQEKKRRSNRISERDTKELNVTYDIIIPDSILTEGRLKGVTAFPETFL